MSQTPTGAIPDPGSPPRLSDPRTTQANHRFPGRRHDYPGGTGAMDPVPDHGEDSYRGRPDGPVDNAGFQMTVEPLGDLETERHERTFETHVHALPWLAEAAPPHLAPGTSIINTTSIQGYHPSPSLLDYAATKAAIISLSYSLADSLGARGIRVNAVAPGPIWTPLQPPTQPEEKIRNFGQDTSLGRAGQPAEPAGANACLADPDSPYVSGTVIGVTGGRYLA